MGRFEIRRILPHELSHLVVYQTTQNPYNRPPVWLDEGLAITNQEAQEPEMATALKNATAAGALIRLRSLQGAFPADPDAAYLAYAESASVVRFLIARYGAAKVGATLTAFRDGVTYDEALRAGIGADTDALDAAWRAWAPAALGVSPAAQTALAGLAAPAASVTAGEIAPGTASVAPCRGAHGGSICYAGRAAWRRRAGQPLVVGGRLRRAGRRASPGGPGATGPRARMNGRRPSRRICSRRMNTVLDEETN